MMVDFWAEWCGPCRALSPVLEELASESAGRVTLAKVNVDENPGLAARYGIRSIPTILFVKQGKVVADQDRRDRTDPVAGGKARVLVHRSEEHTSELQSQSNLVC